jgi:hypothetical protein
MQVKTETKFILLLSFIIGTSSEYPAPNAFGAGMKDDNIIIFYLTKKIPRSLLRGASFRFFLSHF